MRYLLVLENKNKSNLIWIEEKEEEKIKRAHQWINDTYSDYQKEIVADEDYDSLLLMINLYLLELIQV